MDSIVMSSVSVCELCDGAGWVEQTPGEWPRHVTRCSCWLKNRATWADGVPLEFRDARLANYAPLPGNQAAIRAAKACLREGRDLFLVGPVGSGKTRLAASVLNEHFDATHSGRFLRVASWLDELRLSGNDRSQELHARERMSAVPMLVLDDLGLQTPSQFANLELAKLSDSRWDRGVRTIWTSNLALSCGKYDPSDPDRPQTLGEFLGDDRLPSRLAGRSEIAFLDVPDQRVRGRGRPVVGGGRR